MPVESTGCRPEASTRSATSSAQCTGCCMAAEGTTPPCTPQRCCPAGVRHGRNPPTMTGPMTLREAAERTDRSVTTLRRYIRNGRLRAEMREGRYGPGQVLEGDEVLGAGL